MRKKRLVEARGGCEGGRRRLGNRVGVVDDDDELWRKQFKRRKMMQELATLLRMKKISTKKDVKHR